jgi:hypothetical protein
LSKQGSALYKTGSQRGGREFKLDRRMPKFVHNMHPLHPAGSLVQSADQGELQVQWVGQYELGQKEAERPGKGAGEEFPCVGLL